MSKLWKWSILCLCITLMQNAGAEPIPYSKNNINFTGGLDEPEQVLAYLKAAPKKRKEAEAYLYKIALRDIKRIQSKSGSSWSAATKAGFEGAGFYPTGRALLLGAEAKLRSWAGIPKMNSELDKETGEFIVGLFNSAMAVEAYESTLDNAQRAKLIPYRDCLKRYLDTGKPEPTCVPLQWAGIVPAR